MCLSALFRGRFDFAFSRLSVLSFLVSSASLSSSPLPSCLPFSHSFLVPFLLFPLLLLQVNIHVFPFAGLRTHGEAGMPVSSLLPSASVPFSSFFIERFEEEKRWQTRKRRQGRVPDQEKKTKAPFSQWVPVSIRLRFLYLLSFLVLSLLFWGVGTLERKEQPMACRFSPLGSRASFQGAHRKNSSRPLSPSSSSFFSSSFPACLFLLRKHRDLISSWGSEASSTCRRAEVCL